MLQRIIVLKRVCLFFLAKPLKMEIIGLHTQVIMKDIETQACSLKENTKLNSFWLTSHLDVIGKG